jgi:hypothetical protein
METKPQNTVVLPSSLAWPESSAGNPSKSVLERREGFDIGSGLWPFNSVLLSNLCKS